jgi:hypothetical protein
MKSLTWCCGSAIALCLLLGCEKKQETPSAPATEASAVAQNPTPAPAAADKMPAATTLDLAKVPVEEQFEQEIEAEVTPANLEQQLEGLEKDLQAP